MTEVSNSTMTCVATVPGNYTYPPPFQPFPGPSVKNDWVLNLKLVLLPVFLGECLDRCRDELVADPSL